MFTISYERGRGFPRTNRYGVYGVLVDTFVVRQYHYQTLELSEQRLVPYQILCRAKASGHGLYSIPSSWLDMQPHLLGQGE